MRIRSIHLRCMGLVGGAVLSAACASQSAQEAGARGPQESARARAPEPARPAKVATPSDSEAPSTTSDRAAVDHQIAMLRKEISLYRQFIAHAGDDPHYREPVQKSRERIEDAENTLAFLLSGLNEPPKSDD